MKIEKAKKILEAILFAAGYPVDYDKLADVLELEVGQIKAILEDESEKYEDRGIQLVMFDDACQLCTKEEYESYVKQALGMRSGGGLSNSSLEVLAIVAYNQPVTRAFIEQVRGVDSSYAIGVLCERQMIRAVGKLDVPGRPNLYATTDDFLRCFGLRSIAELPQNDIMSDKGDAELWKTALGLGGAAATEESAEGTRSGGEMPAGAALDLGDDSGSDTYGAADVATAADSAATESDGA